MKYGIIAKLMSAVLLSVKNKYSVEDGKTINQYTAYFYTCGICRLMTELGLKEYIPAMCTLDYDMAEHGVHERTDISRRRIVMRLSLRS